MAVSPNSDFLLRLVAAGWAISVGGQTQDAVGLLERALSGVNPATTDDLLALAALVELAAAYDEYGDTPRALELSRIVLDRQSCLLPSGHPDVLSSRANLAYLTGRSGDPTTARDQFAGIVADSTRNLGTDHPGTLGYRNFHAVLTGRVGDPTTARELLAQIVTDCTRILGPRHRTTLMSRNSYAVMTGRVGDPTTARELLAQIVADCTRILGPDHRTTLMSRYNHANSTGRAGDGTKARDLFASIVNDHIRVLGPRHPGSLASRSSYDFWNSWRGRRAVVTGVAMLRGFKRLPDEIVSVARAIRDKVTDPANPERRLAAAVVAASEGDHTLAATLPIEERKLALELIAALPPT